MAFSVLGALAGCAAGDGPGTNGSGNVVVNGDLTIVKVFGACLRARSGIAAQSEGTSDLGGQVDADVTTRTVGVGGSTAAVFAGTLGALDECLVDLKLEGYDVEELVAELERLGFTVTPPPDNR